LEITKMTQNNPEQCQADFWSCRNSGGALLHSPPPLAAHAQPPMKVAETGGLGPSSSSLSPCAGGDLQQQQKRNNQLILVFISFVFVLLRFFLLFVRSGFYFSSSRFRIRFFLQIGLLCVSSSSPLHSSGGGVVGVAAMVQALMIFAPFGRSGGGRGRSAGVWSVQRRAGG
jgi:hypothetical protein